MEEPSEPEIVENLADLAKEPVAVPEFGEQLGHLTRFGSCWIDLSDVNFISLDPPDGCGAEVYVRRDPKPFHLGYEDGAALKAYLAMHSTKPSS